MERRRVDFGLVRLADTLRFVFTVARTVALPLRALGFPAVALRTFDLSALRVELLAVFARALDFVDAPRALAFDAGLRDLAFVVVRALLLATTFPAFALLEVRLVDLAAVPDRLTTEPRGFRFSAVSC